MGYIHGSEVVRESIFTGGNAEKLLLLLREDGVPAQENDLLFAGVHLLDAPNHPAYGSESEVSLTISGPAEIVGPVHKQTEAGIVSFLIRTGNAGTVTLYATSHDLAPAELKIELQSV